MRKYGFFQKLTSVLLSVMLVVGMLPGVSLPAAAADEAEQTGSAELATAGRVSDPSTMNEWEDYFGPDMLSTEFAGGVWTDKSVFTDADEFRAEITMDDPDNHFLIALSAIAANQQVVGYASAPMDVMLVLDVSGSMDTDGKDTAMIIAANQALETLLSQNLNNRVGVVLYSGSQMTNQTAGTDTATVILPLDHYTTTSTANIGSAGAAQYIPAYLTLSNSDDISVASGVRNSSNQQVDSGSKNVSGGTYIQNGLYQAWEEFSNVTDTVVPAGQVQAGAQRTPIMVLLSDGQPTLATASYHNVGNSNNSYGNGSTNSTTWQTVFLTQLTAAFVKSKMASHYGTAAKFYTLGLGTGTSQYATAVLNPSYSNSTINSYWNNFLNNTPNANGNVTVVSGSGNNRWSLYKDSNVTSRNYVDQYWLSSDASGLISTFKNLINTIVDEAGYVTLVDPESGEDTSGYITFTDELGVMMEVKDVKGLVLGETLFTGHELAKSLQETEMGTQENPTEYGDAFIATVMERLGIEEVSVAQQLVIAAYADQQLYYNAATGEYSNYIGWYSDDDGTYLGFWDKDTGITATGAPEGAAWINKSYGYLGTAGNSDMMHVVVMVSTHIESGMQVVQFKIPASLIPMVTYNVELNGTDPTDMKRLTRTDADPLRLVYEVGLQSGLNEVNLTQKLAELPEEVYVHKNEDGSYSFYTNLWGDGEGGTDVDYNDPLSHQVAQSHFHPAEGNGRYYYVEDTPVYVGSGSDYTLYTGTQAPTGDGYYRAYHYYTGEGYTTEYLPMSNYALNMAAAYGQQADGYWYIPQGAIFQQLDRFHAKKSENITGTLEYYDYPVVVDMGEVYDTYAFLGNNGKITVIPAQGIKLTKTVTETVADAPERFTFRITLSEAVAAPTVTDPNGQALTDWSVSGNVITVTLEAGETVYITGLPTGVTYTVEEEVTGYYAASSTNASGTVAAYTVNAVDFVNTPKGYGNLIVSKDVDHPYTNVPAALTQKQFPITVTLSGADVANRTFAVTGSDSVTSVTTDQNGSFTVYLKDNASLTVVGLPEGTAFTTTEDLDDTEFKGFSMDADRSVLTGTVVKDSTVQTHVVNEYAPNSPTASIQVTGTKTLVDTAGTFDWEGKSFTVRLEQYVDGVYNTLAEAEVTEDSLRYAFTDQIRLNAIGTYYYKVSEVIPTDRLPGMSYDATIGRFVVVVTDNDVDGELEFAVYDYDTKEEISGTDNVYSFNKDFVNTHTTDATYVEFTVYKDVIDTNGTGTTEAGYLFELYEVINGTVSAAAAYSMRTVQTADGGQATFHIPITEVGERTFILKETEPQASEKIPGMLYDDTQYTVVVGAAADDGELAPYVTFSKNGSAVEEKDLIFTNEIDLTPLTLKPYVTKTLQGRDPMEGDEFHFHLEQTDGSFVPGSLANGYTDDLTVDYETLINGGVAYYKELSITQVGTYYFRSVEVAGNAGGMTYDSGIYHITVNVTVQDGALHKAVTFVKVGDGNASTAMDSVRFTNTYRNTDTAQVTLGGTKSLTGKSLVSGAYRFTLSENGKELETVSNLANGAFTFTPITYTAADIGQHTYIISEVVPEGGVKDGVTYDEKTYTVTVTVTDNGNGELVVTTAGADGIKFENTYSAAATDLTVSGSKSWVNTDLGTAKALDGGEFTFVLYESNSSWSVQGDEVGTASNAADGSFSFKLEYTTAGERYYLLREVIGDETGVSYDTATYRIKVSVYDNGVGSLVATVSEMTKEGVGRVSSITFGNLYTPEETELTVTGEKELTGRTLLDGEFTFALYQADAQFNITGDPLQTVSNEGTAFAFAPMRYTKSGTYYYVVMEVVPDAAEGGVYDGVKYDTAQLGITVTVTDNGSGALEADYTVTGGELKFSNTYTVSGIAYFDVSGQKTLENKTLEEKQFSFEILDANRVRVALVQNDGDGGFTFRNIPLTSLGDHTFYIREVNDNRGGITYDTREYTVTVTASDDGRGGLTAGTPVITLNGTATEVRFVNSYSVESVSVRLRASKTLQGMDIKAGQFLFRLKQGDDVLQEVSNLSAGGVVFDAIEYTEPGEHTYTISEVVPEGGVQDGITYDTHTVTARVVVTDNGDGTLSADVTYEGLRQFVNVYSVTGTTAFDLSGTKILENKALQDGLFTFELYENGEVVAQTTNVGGTFTFEDVVMNTPGVHTYTLVEKIPGDAVNNRKDGITYDTRSYTVKVEAMDNGVGGLTAGAPVVTLNGVVREPVFTNTYTVTGTTAFDLSGTKELLGVKALTDGLFTFELYKDGEPVAQTANVGTAFTFEDVTLDSLGTHTFTLVEKVPDGAVDNVKDGITYDDIVYTVQVEVTDNGIGGIQAQEPVFYLGAVPTDTATFTNRYDVRGTSVDITGTKILTGKKLEDGMFAFELLKDGERVALAQNVGSTFTFRNIPLDTLGEHKFTVRELIPDEAEGNVYRGVTYCDNEYVVDVSLTATDDGVGGMLVSEPVYSRNGSAVSDIRFENSYTVTGSATFDAVGTKTLTGGMSLTDGMFLFDMYEGDVLVATATNVNGQIRFADVPVATVGEHIYRVTERTGELDGVSYSDLCYTVKVNVVDNGDGTVSAQAPVYLLGEETVQSLDFVNTYIPADLTVPVQIRKTVDNKGTATLSPKGFVFALYRDGKEISRATTDENGLAAMELTLTAQDLQAQTVSYQIKEIDTGLADVTYSTQTYTVDVKLTQNTDGTLAAELTVNGQSAERITAQFVNVYSPSSTPKTGDGSKPVMLIAMMGGSALCVVVLLAVLVIGKKKKNPVA